MTITKSITITPQARGRRAGIRDERHFVNAVSTDNVLLEGLDIEGLGTGLNGITIIGGGRTTIRKCSIRNFTQNGVNVVGAKARAL